VLVSISKEKERDKTIFPSQEIFIYCYLTCTHNNNNIGYFYH